MRSLRFRLLLMFGLVVTVAIGTVAIFASLSTASQFQRYVDDKFIRDQETISKLLSSYSANQDPTATQNLVEQMAQVAGQRILLIDPARKVIADSRRELIGQILTDEIVQQVLGNNFVINADVGDKPQLQAFLFRQVASNVPPGGDVLSIGAPYYVVNTPGSLIVPTNLDVSKTTIPIGSPEQSFLGGVNQSLWLAGVVAGIVAVLVTLLLSSRILKPVKALTVAATKMEKGDLSQRVAVKTKDEIGELAHAFNAMADSLKRSEDLRRNMVSDVAHELRTPLTNIQGYLEALQDGITEPNPEIIASLHEESLLLARLVNDLQELALAEAGQLKLECRPVAPGLIIEKTVTVLQAQTSHKNLALKVEIAPDLPLVKADPERVGQVLRNLLTNALRHTPTGGQITITAKQHDDLVEIKVADSGVGIPEEHLPYIFERFYRVDRSRTRATGGTGLGLAIVRQMIEAHGGQVSVKSREGEGSSFTFTLPITNKTECVNQIIA